MAAPYTLHGVWLSGPTYKAGLMLSLTGQKFDYEFVNLREGAGQKPDYKAKSRWGQVPCLTVAATAKNLCQSAAILGYLAQATGKFAGANAVGPPVTMPSINLPDCAAIAGQSIASSACRLPMIPGSTPNTPPSAQLGTSPGGGGSG